MPDHDRIQQILDLHLKEAKRPVDVMFKKKGNKAEITYVNDKTKGLPSWIKLGDSFPYKDVEKLEANWEVYNADGWKQKDGFIV